MPDDPKAIQHWVAEGERLYGSAAREYQALQANIEELEKKAAEKLAELNRIGQAIGRPAVVSIRRMSVHRQASEEPIVVVDSPGSVSTQQAIARALNGELG